MDFSALKPVAAEWSTPEDVNPTREWLRDSWANRTNDKTGRPGQVTVPADQAKPLFHLLTRAGETENLGVSVRIVVKNKEYAPSVEFWKELEKAKATPVAVKFVAKVRTVRPRKAAEVAGN